MDVNAPISLVTATYSTRDGAVEDFNAVWSARNEGAFHHTSVAVLTKDDDGFFHVDQNDNTAKYLVWVAHCWAERTSSSDRPWASRCCPGSA
jgi:hypothetical protein